MRILFVSNLFPPYARGGYEQWCEEVAYELAGRGHSVAVLTAAAPAANSNGHHDGPQVDTGRPFVVYRLLHTQVGGSLAQTLLRLVREPQRHERENLAHVQRVIAEFGPEAALIWGMWNIDRSVPQRIEGLLGSRVAYYFCDYWPALPSAYVQRMQEPARRAQMQQIKSLVGRYFLPQLVDLTAPPLRLEHPICVSRAVRDLLVARGVGVAHAKVIYGGTAVEEFNGLQPVPGSEDGTLRLVYMGRLERMKGVHTIVQAMQSTEGSVTLDIWGGGDPDYVAELQASIAAAGLQARVRLLGPVPRAQVPQVLSQYDALVFSSEWEEPFARTVLEAMAAGLVVVGTTTGGTGELLVEGETGLTFAAGSAPELSAQIRRLASDPPLRRRLADTAGRTVRQYYALGRMVDELERELLAIADQPVLMAR